MTSLDLVAESFRNCSDSEEAWQIALGHFKQFGECWISYGVADRSNTRIYAYRNSMRAEFPDYFVSNGLQKYDYLWKHCVTSRETLAIEVGIIRDDDALKDWREILDPHLLKFGISAILYQPFRERELFSGFGAFLISTEYKSAFLCEDAKNDFRTIAMLFRAHYDFGADEKSIPEYIDKHRIGVLSPRERETLRRLSQGHQTERIATQMGISVPGVKKHLASSRRKLGARTREQALAIAMRYGQI